MGGFRCGVENYYQDPIQQVQEGIDMNLIKAASENNSILLQKAWQGKATDIFPVISQPSVYNFYVEEDKKDGLRMVYRDSLRLQLEEIEKAIHAGGIILPMVLCDFNVLAISSIFDPDLVESSDLDDAYVMPVFKSRHDLEKLEKPDINRGLIPLIINETKRLRSSLPDYISVGVRLNTAPLTLASELRGATEIIYDMLEAPDLYHHFLDILTDLYIEVRHRVHEAAGIKLHKGRVHADVSHHTATNGVCICEDSIALLGPDQFEEFAAPYLIRILNTFGGGTIHSCGNTTQIWPALANMPGWDGFEFGQSDMVDWRAARKAFPDKNLIFYDCGADDEESMDMMQKLLHEPKTFIYSTIYPNIRIWREEYCKK